MKRHCNLELQLVTPSVISHSSDYINGRSCQPPMDDKQLTIFYNGSIAVCDVTEIQARSIILLASRQMEEKSTRTSRPKSPSPLQSLNSPIYTPTAGLSMKRSLQRFLQKRKTRVQATSPYHQ